MTKVPLEALGDAAHAYNALDRAIFNHFDDPEEFRHEVELAQAHLRGIALRMGWSK